MATIPDKRQNEMEPLLAELGEAAEQAERDADEPFPPTWDPNKNAEQPNPLIMAAFPTPIRPNGCDPLIEAMHLDGRVFTVWIGSNLGKRITAAGVRVGTPCAIKKSAATHSITLANGQPGSAYRYTVTTPQTLTLPRTRGGEAVSMEALAALCQADDVVDGELQDAPRRALVPDPPRTTPATGEDDLPY